MQCRACTKGGADAACHVGMAKSSRRELLELAATEHVIVRTTSLPCFKVNAFCAFVNLDAFVLFRPSPAGRVERKMPTQDGSVLRTQITFSEQTPMACTRRVGTLGHDNSSARLPVETDR